MRDEALRLLMPKHKNSIKHDPENGKYGDCHRACFATILGLPLEEVPHFYQDPVVPGQPLIDAFLSRFGLIEANVLFPGETDFALMMGTTKYAMPGVPAILSGKSRTGCNHSVVILDGEIYNDPAESGIIGPLGDGFYCISTFVAQPGFAARKAESEAVEVDWDRGMVPAPRNDDAKVQRLELGLAAAALDRWASAVENGRDPRLSADHLRDMARAVRAALGPTT